MTEIKKFKADIKYRDGSRHVAIYHGRILKEAERLINDTVLHGGKAIKSLKITEVK